jgi:hypothetical protein
MENPFDTMDAFPSSIKNEDGQSFSGEGYSYNNEEEELSYEEPEYEHSNKEDNEPEEEELEEEVEELPGPVLAQPPVQDDRQFETLEDFFTEAMGRGASRPNCIQYIRES